MGCAGGFSAATDTALKPSLTLDLPLSPQGDGIKQMDAFAFGVMLCEVLYLEAPFEGAADNEVWKRKAEQCHLYYDQQIQNFAGCPALLSPDTCPMEALLKTLSKECQCVDPSQRPTFSKVVKRIEAAIKVMDAAAATADVTTPAALAL